MYLEALPLVRKLFEILLIFHLHHEDLTHFLCLLHFTHSLRAPVVVSTNLISPDDAADYLGNLVLETILDRLDPMLECPKAYGTEWQKIENICA